MVSFFTIKIIVVLFLYNYLLNIRKRQILDALFIIDSFFGIIEC